MEVLTSLFTILIIVALGILSRKAGIFKAEQAKTLSSFVYYFALPALFFVKISNLDLFALDPQLVLGSLLPTVLVLVFLLILKWTGLIQKDTYLLLSLSISFGSYAFFGVAFFETFQDGIWMEHSILAASVLGILGITATISPIPVADRFLSFDLPIMIAVSLVLSALLLTRPVIGRGMGVVLLIAYVAYIWAAQG